MTEKTTPDLSRYPPWVQDYYRQLGELPPGWSRNERVGAAVWFTGKVMTSLFLAGLIIFIAIVLIIAIL